ncbi:MAG TPA: SBBP repeat-containing protein [Candidatus Syntrophosphaera sp.]|nr:SBBP repeat-containing protein [Candidatus Syntrophosphaera sp.]
MKNLILVCLVVFLGSMAYAQNDPQWLWATTVGGTGWDQPYSQATDSNGNNYVVFLFQDTVTIGTYTFVSSGSFDFLIAKLDPNGNCLWATRTGGTGDDRCYDIAIDSSGNSYVTGIFTGDVDFHVITQTSVGDWDIFVAKIDPDGNWLWVRRAGGNGEDWGYSLATDSSGNSYLTGYFNLAANFGTIALTSSGNFDTFIAKVDTFGNWLWAIRAGGTNTDLGYGITLDGNQNIYVAGVYMGTGVFGASTLGNSGDYDVYLGKLDSAGNWLWAKRTGGVSTDWCWTIDTDGDGNLYATGNFYGSSDFGTTTLTSSGSSDIYVCKLDTNGNWLWARSAGGTGEEWGYGLTTDNSGNIYITGGFSESATFGMTQLTSNGSKDIYVANLDSGGNWHWAISAGAVDTDSGMSVSFDSNENLYIQGAYSTNMNLGPLALTNHGGFDAFIAKLAPGVGIDDELAPDLTDVSCLSDAWPNPFRVGTTATIKANVAQRESGTLTIYNLRGQIVQSQQLSSGSHEIAINGKDLPAGIYLYQLKTPSVVTSKKLVLLK